MNNTERKELRKIAEERVSGEISSYLLDLQELIQAYADNEQDKIDNLPDSLQYGEKADRMRDYIDALEEACSEIDNLISSIDDLAEILVNVADDNILVIMEARDIRLFYDCCNFWQRMGVKKEDNVIAFALADLILLCKKDFMLDSWNSYYKEVYEVCKKEAMNPKYNENRGQNNFLSESGL